ncbi:Rne/Rng family ribonuclease [Actinocrinis puniceicyclus]|uniref:Ribonuclease E n=1 Tax=Actinocrinis puniceicyclus TaxID=977794 RepID=A0A8J8BCA0_9ACTN|nr:Rne/Rng family ribonuclease [Actinocrinis puniceicyclus]MBS2963923.1 Rne/Rng family ribonuclease [Actinocrinis puniceicyclus]
MLDHEPTGSGSGLEPGHESTTDSPNPTTRRRRAANRPAGAPKAQVAPQPEAAAADAPTPETQNAGVSSPDTTPAAAKRTRSKKIAAAEGAATSAPAKKTARKSATRKATAAAHADESGAAPEPATVVAQPEAGHDPVESAPAKKTARKSTTRRRTRTAEAETTEAAEVAKVAKVAEATESTPPAAAAAAATETESSAATETTETAQPVTGRARRTRKRATAPAATAAQPPEGEAGEEVTAPRTEPDETDSPADDQPQQAPAPLAPSRPGMPIFQAPVVTEPVRRDRAATAAKAQVQAKPAATAAPEPEPEPEQAQAQAAATAGPEPAAERESRRRRRRSRNAGGQALEEVAAARAEAPAQGEGEPSETREPEAADTLLPAAESEGSSRRRRRRRRRQTAEDLAVGAETEEDNPPNTVVKIREPRERRSGRLLEPDSVRTGDDVLGVRGSVRLAAKQQRRRDGRSTRSRRAPIVSEAEFLARRESVERVMVVRQAAHRMQIGVLEDGVLVEHYVNRESSVSYVGNVYLGKVQNVLPSMEAAFVDINKGRNAVLYAGEVNFSAAGLEGQPKRIESALKSGQPVLVQVTKDPIGHKGARLTSQISLPGRFLVYIPGGSMMGISRKLPDNERTRLKQILKKVVPEDGGVIVRTAAEGASEEELARDVERLVAQWEEIERRSRTANAPALLYGEPDLTVRVIRDIFNEDFSKLIVSGDEAYKTIHDYLSGVAPELAERLEQWTGATDVFTVYRVEEQLAKGLDRKVWLPSGGSLVIDRTEAMVVIDVNTGKFTGQGSNSLEETVTRNNLEAAEEIVRQLRLRDLGGIIVIDFIDMVLESNRDLVLRRLLECLGRDRTKHQVAEVTSLGLVQMTRKRVGQGLLEAFSETCDHCNGRGIIVHVDPVEPHGRKVTERSAAVVERIDRVTGENGPHEHADADEGGHLPGAAETRASRRRRRKGKHHEGEDLLDAAVEPVWTEDTDIGTVDTAGTAGTADTRGGAAASAAPPPATPAISLKAHAEDPDAAAVSDELNEALIDTGRPRKRRRAASRPAGSPQSAAEAS